MTYPTLSNFILAILFFPIVAFAKNEPPKVFIDKGACPFECCTYREWTVKKDTLLYDQVDGKKVVGKAIKGTRVTGVTGEVHTITRKVKVSDGQELYLLTYQGEGFWKVWQDGAVKTDVELDVSDEKWPDGTWWVQIKLKNGKTGWTKQPGNFAHIDACE